MTIKQTVKQALARVPGNTWFTSKLTIIHPAGAISDGGVIRYLSPAQIARALRDIPYVQKDGKGNYRVRGRKVPVS